MPAKRVIVLENKRNMQEGVEAPRRFSVALWADVPVARQPFYVTTAVSAWSGASGPENADLQAGRVVERRTDVVLVPTATLADAQALLQALWQAYQDEITAANPWNRYGTFWDGATWTPGGVA